MKKILICLPSLNCGDGIAKVIMSRYDSLVSNKITVDFFLVLDTEMKEEYLEKIKKNGGKIFVLPKHSKFLKFCTASKFLKNIMKKSNYDVVHINLIDRYAYACVKIMKNKAKIIYHVHNPFSKTKIGILSEILNNRCIKDSDLLLASSECAGKSMFKKNKFIVLNNSIDVKLYKFDLKKRNNLREKLKIKENDVLIGTVARMSEQKNPFFALKIIECCIEEKSNIRYLWIGKGELDEKIESYVENSKILKDRFIWIKNVDLIQEYYFAMDGFILPSLYEGLGIVAIEAQAAGVSTIVSNNVPQETDVTDLIKYIELDDIQEWKKTILEIENKLNLREKYNNIIKESVFNIDNTNNDLYELYKKSWEK